MIKIAICDDSIQSAEKIKSQVFEFAQKKQRLIEIEIFTDGRELIDAICKNPAKYNILLLDVDMPKVSGLEVAKCIRKTNSDILLIFISAYPQYVFEAIEYMPFRYIRKERLQQEFPYALEASFRVIDSNKDASTYIKTEEGECYIKHSSVMYFESQSYLHKISIHLENGSTLTTRDSIKNLYCKFNDENFIKIHSGCVVNAKYIRNFSSADVTLDNGQKLIISRSHVKEVKTTLLKYWGNKI